MRKEANFLKKKKEKNPQPNKNNQPTTTKPHQKQKLKTTTADTLSVFLPFSIMGSSASGEKNVRTEGHQAFFFWPRTTGFSQGWPCRLCITKGVLCHNNWNEEEIGLLSVKMGAGTSSWSKLYKVIEPHWARPKTSPTDLLYLTSFWSKMEPFQNNVLW